MCASNGLGSYSEFEQHTAGAVRVAPVSTPLAAASPAAPAVAAPAAVAGEEPLVDAVLRVLQCVAACCSVLQNGDEALVDAELDAAHDVCVLPP